MVVPVSVACLAVPPAGGPFSLLFSFAASSLRNVVGSVIFLFLDCVSLPDWTQKYRLLAVIGRTSGGKLLGSYLPCWEGWRAKSPPHSGAGGVCC